MKLLLSILILLCASALAQVPSLPVPGGLPDAAAISNAAVRVEYVVPEPVTIRLEFYSELTGEPFTIDATVPSDHAFAGYKIIKGVPPIGYPVSPTNFPGGVGLPIERLAIPELDGMHYVCIWDETAKRWSGYLPYDHSGTYDFQVPAWDQWYWIGLWCPAKNEYVYDKWIGHFIIRDGAR